MNLVNDQIRALAQRIARSHGLELVELEFQGSGKNRILRIFLERDAAGRDALAERLAVLRAETPSGPQQPGTEIPEARIAAEETSGAIVLDLVDAGETAGLDPADDDLAYLRELPEGVPIAQLSGITHGDCERFARDFGTALDIEDLVPGAEYMLEVSSPGLDRKLSSVEEFERFTGQLCKLQTFTPVAGNRHWRGRLGAMHDGLLCFEPVAEKPPKKKAAAAAPIEIALANIEKAQLIPEF